MSAEPTHQPTAEDFAYSAAKKVVKDIMASEREITRLMAHVSCQKQLLSTVCPHKYVQPEYDDDFHRPRTYIVCRLCGANV